jgi:hypothetical protein
MIEVDVIGVLYLPQADPDAEPVAYPGWRVNITVDGLAARPDLEPFVVTPTRLRQVWAGDDPTAPDVTVALAFADEEEAGAVLQLP